jgi:filamentous hemagglutinin family protein
MKNPVMLGSCSTIAALALSIGIAMPSPAQIVPTPTGDPGATGTIVTPTNTQIDITGGTQAGSALFHSFTQFDVNQGQIANFQTPAEIQNVLTRVTGGSPAMIDGTLQLSGAKANLYFMNPAGIVFGPNANFNLPASFLATTASSMRLSSPVDMVTPTVLLGEFKSVGENVYGSIDAIGSVTLNFGSTATGSILNSSKLSLTGGPNHSLSLIGHNVWSTTDIKTNSNILIGSVPTEMAWPILIQQSGEFTGFSAAELSTTDNQLLQGLAIPGLASLVDRSNQQFSSNISGSQLPTQPGDLVVRNLEANGSVGLVVFPGSTSIVAGNILSSGNVELATRLNPIGILPLDNQARSIQVGNIQANGQITVEINGDITTGHLKSLGGQIVSYDSPRTNRGITLETFGAASRIQVSSLLAKSSENDPKIKNDIFIRQTNGTFQVTETIANNDLGKIKTDIVSETPESNFSIAADGKITFIGTIGQPLLEGSGLERDANGYAVYRLASNPETRVEIIAINPQDSSLILRDQATGAVIVGDRVILRTTNTPMPSGTSTTKGLIARFEQQDGALSELSGSIKRKLGFDRDGTNLDYQYRSGISVQSQIPTEDILAVITGQKTVLDLNGANPLGGSLPGAYSIDANITNPSPLSPEIQTALQAYEQKLIPIAPPTNPIGEPINPTPTPIDALVEPPQAPDFSEASILNATIDPTDTIDLSAGAIRGAAINPGGLLKVELDTRNPEGVLTRKVTK